MIAPPECDKVLLVQAEFDGELDAAAAAALATHQASCPICQAAAAELAQARALIGDSSYYPMPDDVRARLMQKLVETQPDDVAVWRAVSPRPATRGAAFDRLRRWWASAASFGLGAACAAALALLVIAPSERALTDQVVAGHIRALQPGHLEDVVSTDRHTVKPWFDGRIDFAPPVKDLAAWQFPLKGGRLDYLDGRPVAAMVYQRDKHLINLFTWPTDAQPAAPEATQRQGYNVVHWTQDGMALWAVSDVELAQLREFAEDWRRSP